MTGIAGMAGIAGVTAGETQLCIQCNCFPLRNNERSALGCGILELIGYGGHICLGRAEERYAQMMAVGGINRPDKTAVGAAKLQCIIEYIFQLDIPAALLQRIWPFPQKLQLLALKSALESNSKAPIRQPPLKLWFLLT